MFKRFQDFERRFVVNFNTPPTEPTPTGGGAGGGQKPDDVQALKERIAALEKEKQDWSSKQDKDKDLTLNEKVKREREDQDRKNSEAKVIESAIKFNLTSSDFFKANESILPKEIPDILRAAEKETYESPMHKANAIKAEIIQSFFEIQSNIDLLTDSQKSMFADYLKLTKNGKEERAQEIYANLFEPALNTLKRVKKAEEVNRAKNGFGVSTDADQAYKDKLINMAEKKFFRGKNA